MILERAVTEERMLAAGANIFDENGGNFVEAQKKKMSLLESNL